MMEIELDKQYNVKYIGNNEDILKRGDNILALTVIKREEGVTPKHFWSKMTYKTVYDLEYVARPEKIECYPECRKGWLSSFDGINYFDTFEDAVKFVSENFVERGIEYWDEISLTPRNDFFKPILHDKSHHFILLEDTLTHNVYIATKNNNVYTSIAPYFGSDGKILKANKFNPTKFSISSHNLKGTKANI